MEIIVKRNHELNLIRGPVFLRSVPFWIETVVLVPCIAFRMLWGSFCFLHLLAGDVLPVRDRGTTSTKQATPICVQHRSSLRMYTQRRLQLPALSEVGYTDYTVGRSQHEVFLVVHVPT